MDDFAAFVWFPSYRQPSAAEIHKIHQERSEYCEMDDVAAFVDSPHFGSFRRPEIQKIHEALEMASGKGANIAKWTILLLLWGSLHFGSFENPRGLEIARKSKWTILPFGNGFQ